MSPRLLPPAPLTADHQLADFACGEPVLDDWLRRRALANQLGGASRSFVVADTDGRAHGYYALAAGAVSRQSTAPALRRNMPDPIPVLVLGRLAVDARSQRRRLGASMLRDAVERSMQVATHAGVRALLVHALHDRASGFYQHFGFVSAPFDPMVLMLHIRADAASPSAPSASST